MSTANHTYVASSTPSRTRVKVSQKRRNSEEMARIVSAIKTHLEVHEVRTNIHTGSIVVHHAHKDNSLDEISAILQDLGIILSSTTATELPLSRGKSKVAADLTSAVSDLNERVGQATNGVFDLRLLVPVGLASLALRELIRNEWEFQAAPWYVLVWYAFDSFIKLHYTADTPTKTE